MARKSKETDVKKEIPSSRRSLLDRLKKENPTIQKLGYIGDTDLLSPIQSFSTQSMILDHKIPYGGIPRRRISQFYGPERSLKTTLALKVGLSALQENDTNIVMYVDLERSFDDDNTEDFLKYLGYKEEYFKDQRFIYVRDTAETCFNVAEAFIQDDDAALLIVDSLGAVITKEMYTKKYGEHQKMMMDTKLKQDFLARTNAINNNCAILVLNQARDNTGYGHTPYIYTGGRALRHFLSLNINMNAYHERGDKEDKSEGNTKVKMNLKIEKCKIGSENAQISLIYSLTNGGFDEDYELVEMCDQLKILKQAGAWMTLYSDIDFGGEILFRCQGREKAVEELKSNEKTKEIIKQKIFENVYKDKAQKIDWHKVEEVYFEPDVIVTDEEIMETEYDQPIEESAY